MSNSYFGDVPHTRKIQFDPDGPTRRLRAILDHLYLAGSDLYILQAENIPPTGISSGTFTTNIATVQTAMSTLIQDVLACMPVQDPSQDA
jgi:hypothetical protein